MAANFTEISKPLQKELREAACAILAPGKGVLPQDATIENIGKNFKELGIPDTEQSRILFRQILFSTEGMNEHIAGVILFDESVYHKMEDGTPFPQYLQTKGILSGIKIDCDPVPLPGTEEEWVTQGLDNLAQRCAEYKKLGIKFAKWRAPIRISAKTPTTLAINENANALARYAAICQSQGIVPVVEPDVMMAGSHDIQVCQKVTEAVWASLYKALNDHHVYLEGTVLKTNMVTPGFDGPKASAEEVAKATVEALSRTVPIAIAGVGFLSGGMSDDEAIDRLNAINKHQGITKPWPLSFMYGRAIQDSVMRVWSGLKENIPAAQAQFRKRCKAAGMASLGKYTSEADLEI